MSVLSENISVESNFDPDNYVRTICENTKVELHLYRRIEFPIGWASIIHEFIESVKTCRLSLNRISDTYSMLDIEFSIAKSPKEVLIWRAVNKARVDSMKTCMMCGEKNVVRKSIYPMEMMCEACKKYFSIFGKTQTWLDKY